MHSSHAEPSFDLCGEIAKFQTGMSTFTANQLLSMAGDELSKKTRRQSLDQEQLNSLLAAKTILEGWMYKSGQAKNVYATIHGANEIINRLIEQVSMRTIEEGA